MEVKKENVISVYKVADENGKQLLKALFPGVEFEQEKDTRPVTERIKTLEDACKELGDACKELGEEHPLVQQYMLMSAAYKGDPMTRDFIAYIKLRVITAALNEGWVPPFDKKTFMYWPCFKYYTREEIEAMSDKEKHQLGLVGASGNYGSQCVLGYVCSCDAWAYTYSNGASRLAYKSRELAEYSGKQFKELWADCYFIGAFE